MFYYLNKNFRKIILFIVYLHLIFSYKLVLSNQIEDKKDFLSEKHNVSNYILGPGDVLKFILYDEKSFSGEYQILNDGSITPCPD